MERGQRLDVSPIASCVAHVGSKQEQDSSSEVPQAPSVKGARVWSSKPGGGRPQGFAALAWLNAHPWDSLCLRVLSCRDDRNESHRDAMGAAAAKPTATVERSGRRGTRHRMSPPVDRATHPRGARRTAWIVGRLTRPRIRRPLAALLGFASRRCPSSSQRLRPAVAGCRPRSLTATTTHAPRC